jgi:ribosomal protein S18 acetylase RimI-like enzyme
LAARHFHHDVRVRPEVAVAGRSTVLSMSELEIRAMTAEEFGAYRASSIRDYAAEHVRAGNWPSSQAEELAAIQLDDLLPDGVETAGMLLLVAETASAGVVGMVWVELQHGSTTGAWIYDINIDPEHRGRGYGRALLRAAEREVETRGIESIALNVFGGNTVARDLYATSGYQVTSLHMRKRLDSDHDR